MAQTPKAGSSCEKGSISKDLSPEGFCRGGRPRGGQWCGIMACMAMMRAVGGWQSSIRGSATRCYANINVRRT